MGHHEPLRPVTLRWGASVALALVIGSGATLVTLAPAGAYPVTPKAAVAVLGAPMWTKTIRDSGNTITASSPNVGDFVNPAGALAPGVVVGDLAGNVYTYDLATGDPDWVYPAGGPVQSTPSVAALTPGNPATSAFVGVGDAADATPSVPGYQAITPQGNAAWGAFETNPFVTSPHWGVQASLAVGNLQGSTDVTAGSLGQNMLALNAANGAVLPGFPWFQGDSNYATSALADMYGGGGGTPDIVAGGASTAAPNIFGQQYFNGGFTRVISPNGNLGQAQPNQGVDCQAKPNQEVDSSPAVGEFYGPNQIGIAVGTGTFYAGATDTNKVLTFDNHCNPGWSDTLDGTTSASPALADLLGNGSLDVVEGTNAGGGNGSVYALNGATGAVLWHTSVGSVLGGVSTVNIGNGHQDVLVGTSNGNGAYILDGTTGAIVQNILTGNGFQNTPLVTDDPNGTIGITFAGYQGSDSFVWHYEIAGSTGATATETGAWPEFHHDPQLTGDTGTNVSIQVPCNPPAGVPSGYYLSASDGGIFVFGNLPFCGSTGSIHLNNPVVGVAATHDGGGYWEVASDGGIFAFGDAGFHGSTGAIHLNKPVVGMAATPDGGGYWLVASDGGIFAFGDAQFYGSTGAIHLNKPIVGMAATPDGGGYWLVASDGGIFAFGDAAFLGSAGGTHLNAPVVGMAADPTGTGYWLVASDGGIFTFGAGTPFFGSTGALHLNQPIVGMQATLSGGGYRFVAADGGIFDFGNAPFFGSMGGKSLNKPVVAMAGF